MKQITLTPAELDSLAWAVQWAGHFANLEGDCRPDGPAFNAIRRATGIVEANGGTVFHCRAVRDVLERTQLAA